MINLYWKATRRKKKQPVAILDIGCGSAHTIAYFLTRWPLTKFYGIDLSQEAIKFAQKRVPDAQFHIGTLAQVKFGIKFDVIIALGMLEHIEDPGHALQDISKLLSDDGFIYIDTPNCIAYPQSKKIEGFYQLACGSHQWEWYLLRRSWENIINKSGLIISLSLKGPNLMWEFIWVLNKKHENISVL